MGGAEDRFLEGSVLGASFWRWWNQAWAGGEPRVEEDAAKAFPPATVKVLAESTQPPVMDPTQELVYIASVVVPRPRPPRRPAKSKPIDIPTKKPACVPVVQVAEDKRYWYQ